MQWFWIGWMRSWHQCSTLPEFCQEWLLAGGSRRERLTTMGAHGGIRIPLWMELSGAAPQCHCDWISAEIPSGAPHDRNLQGSRSAPGATPGKNPVQSDSGRARDRTAGPGTSGVRAKRKCQNNFALGFALPGVSHLVKVQWSQGDSNS